MPMCQSFKIAKSWCRVGADQGFLDRGLDLLILHDYLSIYPDFSENFP